MNFYAEVNPLRDTTWSSAPTVRTYPSNDNFVGFDNFLGNYSSNPMHASYVSPKSSNFQHNSGDSAVSSTVDIKMQYNHNRNMDPTHVGDYISRIIDSCIDSYCDSSSNGTSTSPEVPTYSGSDGINDENDIAQTSAPILHYMLNKPPAAIPTNGQNYLQNPESISSKSFPSQFQQSQFQLNQAIHNQRCCKLHQCYNPNENQLQVENQLAYRQQYSTASANYLTSMLSYQRSEQSGLGMGAMRLPIAAASRPAPISTTTLCPTLMTDISSSSSAFGRTSRKKADARTKGNKLALDKGEENAVFHFCPICARPFKNKSNIKTHLRTHTKEKPYVCGICQKGFCQKAHLTKHSVIHQRGPVSMK